MQQHSAELSKEARALADSVRDGRRTLTALALIAAATTMREGSELCVFLYGIWMSSDHSSLAMLAGAVGGFVGALGVALVLYFSLARISLRRVFAPIQWLMVFLCGGLAAQAVSQFSAAGLLPSLGERVWDFSPVLSDQSMLGKALATMLGYRSTPSGIEVIAYAFTLIVLGLVMLAQPRMQARTQASRG
jgi:high-affinity iron transporter